jgi:hypothetical protein
MRQQVAGEVDSATLLVGGALKGAFERGNEAGVLVGDDQHAPR